MQSLVDGGYHFIRNGDGREELYRLDDDPDEQFDRIDDVGQGLVEQLRRALISLVRPPPEGRQRDR